MYVNFPRTLHSISCIIRSISSVLTVTVNNSTPSQTSSTSSSSSAQTLATGKAPNPVLYDFKKHDGVDPEGTKKSYPVYWDYLRALFPKQDLNSKEICDNIIGSRTIVKWAKDITWNKYKQEFRLPEHGIHDGEILSPYKSCMKDFMAFFKKTKIVFDAPLTRINIRNSRKRKQRDKPQQLQEATREPRRPKTSFGSHPRPARVINTSTGRPTNNTCCQHACNFYIVCSADG